MIFLLSSGPLLLDAPERTGGWDGGGFSMLILLIVLLGGGLAGLWFYLKRGSLPRLKQERHLELLETRGLGGRQFLVVAQHGKQKFLLGVCPGRIGYLCNLEDSGPSGSDFEHYLGGEEER